MSIREPGNGYIVRGYAEDGSPLYGPPGLYEEASERAGDAMANAHACGPAALEAARQAIEDAKARGD
jgi:hypothetical protein